MPRVTAGVNGRVGVGGGEKKSIILKIFVIWNLKRAGKNNLHGSPLLNSSLSGFCGDTSIAVGEEEAAVVVDDDDDEEDEDEDDRFFLLLFVFFFFAFSFFQFCIAKKI